MKQLSDLIGDFPGRHKSALGWFFAKTGTDGPWPGPLPDGTLLATKAKGIYKPRWTEFALSVRQSLRSPYSDREPVVRADGTWSYLYFQEGDKRSGPDLRYPNRALFRCLEREVPVGVFRENEPGLGQAYHFWGVALVAGWEEGYFFLEGFSRDGVGRERGLGALIEAISTDEEKRFDQEGFNPQGILDARERTLAAIVRRRGQPLFRRRLLRSYEGRCAITGSDVEPVLEAAHIIPYRGPETNHVSNGLLLRGDIHTLFDLGLIAIDTSTMTVIISPTLVGTGYEELAGRRLLLPADRQSHPNREALNQHRVLSGL